ncbi:patatin-like phospholipase domain-containing protein 4 [Pempheris klunzingeri]|uniref:patatin-like phospholipase domain-containing protein 4 n=1 Tax=Pempheris klunzingeri TaxID=3127111 RepID=UPI00397FBC88
MAPGVCSCHHSEVSPSISFSGSGFLATYQLGVAQCFLNYAPWLLRTSPCVLGASAGSLVAAAVVCEMNLSTIRDEMLNFAKQMKAFTLGPLNPSVNVLHWLESILRKYLPSDAHQRASGRLAVAMTRLIDSKLIVMSEFQSKEEVVQALLCSCFVPGYCGVLPPVFKGVHYVDGGFSSMQPLPSAPASSHIVTVCPFSGETDICPADTPSMWDMVVTGTTLKGNVANSLRIINALYPMALENLEQAYDSGYKDAIHFLLNNNIAPHLVIHKVSQGPLNCNQTKIWMHLENTMVEEGEAMKSEKETGTQTAFIDNSYMQMGGSTEHESTRNQLQEPLHFDVVKNVLLSNMVAYLSMFGLPAKILSHLLLPLMLLFNVVLQSRPRLELLFMQAPELMFWAWHGLRHFTFFFFNIVVCSLEKNIKDRVMPTILVLHWLKIQAQYESARGQRHATPSLKFSSSAHSEDVSHGSLHRRLITPSRDYKYM